MLSQIPTHLIAGPLGAGKTSLLQNLLAQRPADERWAVLINEFGQLGLDRALLQSSTESGVSMAEIPGGCLCCVNGVPFQVGLGRLLRKARPDRLWIESSGLGHPAELLQQLAREPWQGVLDLQPLLMVVDAGQLASGEPLPDSQQRSLPLAGLLIANRTDLLSAQTLAQLRSTWPQALPCVHAAISWADIPRHPAPAPSAELTVPAGQPIGQIALLPGQWQRHAQLQQAPYSLAWRVASDQCFSLELLQQWLANLPWQRAKGILHTDKGWKACNLLPGQPIAWTDSAWRQDSRLELICADLPDPQQLEQGLRATCRSQ
ncbi:CobW family GTP-binding protein [Pseudomonas sp.]|uniref:CobW family GTP-binding protein n=1 Tax=Pseudomonas sp. TaxID=306 RepID=UPI0032429EF8